MQVETSQYYVDVGGFASKNASPCVNDMLGRQLTREVSTVGVRFFLLPLSVRERRLVL